MRTRFLWAVIFLLFLVPLSLQAEELSIIFLSGLAEIKTGGQDHDGSLPELATLLRELRSKNKNVLFFHGGSALAPSVLSTIDKGAHMIRLLNELQPDIMAVGKSELAYKEDELSLRTFEAGFPLISSNLLDPLTGGPIEGTSTSRLIQVGKYTLGVMALVDPEVMTDYLPERIRLLDTEPAIRNTAADLRKQGADMIFLLADFRLPRADQYLAERIADFVIISDQTLTPANTLNRVNYHEYPKYSGEVCKLDFELGGTKEKFYWNSKASMLQLSQYQPDSAVTGKISQYLEKINRLHSTPIGQTTTQFSTRRQDVRTTENGFGNLLADIIRDFYHTDIALVNGGCIRGDRQYARGTTLTRGDIHRELPFGNRPVELTVSGRKLLNAIENGLSRIEDRKGRFPHVSGMHVLYDPSAEPMHRIISVHVGSEPLQPERIYSLATLDFLAAGGDGYEMFKNSPIQMNVGGRKQLWEYVLHYIASHKNIAPTVDGRMQATLKRDG